MFDKLHHLPLEKVEELLDFALFLHSRVGTAVQSPEKARPLGLLQGQASCHIGEDFSITEEELLRPGSVEIHS
ncbi:MAG: hypothetical protein ACRERV_03260 [Methylococcales bacterium]